MAALPIHWKTRLILMLMSVSVLSGCGTTWSTSRMVFTDAPLGSERFAAIQTAVLDRAENVGMSCDLVNIERQLYQYLEGRVSPVVWVGISHGGEMVATVREELTFFVPVTESYMTSDNRLSSEHLDWEAWMTEHLTQFGPSSWQRHYLNGRDRDLRNR